MRDFLFPKESKPRPFDRLKVGILDNCIPPGISDRRELIPF